MLSLVIPIFNEEKLIDELVKRTIYSLESFISDYEVIFVDDGSTDQSLNKILSCQKKNKKIKNSRTQESKNENAAGIRLSKSGSGCWLLVA